MAVMLGGTYLAAGRISDAHAQAVRAHDLAAENKGGGSQAWALRLLGEIASHDRPDHAKGHYLESLALATQLGMRPLIAHCHWGLGELDQRERLEQAREQLTVAAAMFREMNMPLALENTEAALHRLR